MTDRITGNGMTLMRQASGTADEYFSSAIEKIDQRLGVGYAREHPELIAAFMQTAALDFGASILARALEAIADRPSD